MSRTGFRELQVDDELIRSINGALKKVLACMSGIDPELDFGNPWVQTAVPRRTQFSTPADTGEATYRFQSGVTELSVTLRPFLVEVIVNTPSATHTVKYKCSPFPERDVENTKYNIQRHDVEEDASKSKAIPVLDRALGKNIGLLGAFLEMASNVERGNQQSPGL